MESIPQEKTYRKAKTMAELFPDLGLLPNETLTAQKKPHSTIAVTRTTVKCIKPLTIAEISNMIEASQVKVPNKSMLSASSAKKQGWNSSVKVDRKISHMANGNIKRNTVRKLFVPNYRSQPLQNTIPKITFNSEKQMFPKPELKVKKASQLAVKNTVRVSGVCKIPDTPLEITKPIRSTIIKANKENINNQVYSNKKVQFQSKPTINRETSRVIMDSPLPNDSFKSNGDASFLRTEKEIQDIEDKSKAIMDEPTLENLQEISPPISTPFTEYRRVQDYFNNTSDMENTVTVQDDTITCFDQPSNSKKTEEREESVIVSLCELLNKASVKQDTPNQNIKLFEFLNQKQIENNIAMIDTCIKSLQDIKESQCKLLSDIRLHEKEIKEINLVQRENSQKVSNQQNSKHLSINKSPSYKIPKKNNCLRKKVFHKSMPNCSSQIQTPTQDKVFSMYMQMKEQMNFLNTPVAKRRIDMHAPNSPAIMSQNLQHQLNKLFNKS